uniref:Glycosyltransferase RgtA/B/C/D-like domain-containing protein n=1 Tax=uncultured bacterium A1Q1_fos_36 TaxID=1256573 RepID=L7VY39_9BACT|nr:hypothetical protein [uncultured bacterium A1Q1_fos_36]
MLEAIVLLLLLVVLASFVVRGDGMAPTHPMDQAFVYTDLRITKSDAGTWRFEYPHLQYSGGISSSLLIGAYKLLVSPSNETLNWHARLLGCSLFFIASFALLQVSVAPRILRVLSLTVIATSGFALLEPTSELYAAAYFTGFLYFMRSDAPWSAAVLLALFGLAKVELLLASALCLAVWVATERDTKVRLSAAAAYLACVVALCLPALYLYGRDGLLGGRAFSALSQHFAELYCGINPMQCAALGGGWDNPNPIVELLFPGAASVADVILHYPAQYTRLLALGFRESFENILIALNGTVFLLAIALSSRSTMDASDRRLCTLVLLTTAASLLPALFVAFVHIRYVARFSPAILVVTLVMLGFSGKHQTRVNWISMAVAATLGIIATMQALLLFPRIAASPHGF